MKRFCTILAIIAFCASVSAQTVKPLAYNMTNGIVMVSTNVTWSNGFKFSTNSVAAQVRTNLLLPAAWLTNTNAGTFRSQVGLGFSALTNTNATNFLQAIGFSTLIEFLRFDFYPDESGPLPQAAESLWDEANAEVALQISDSAITFGNNAPPSLWRSSLGLNLPALTNTSNVTAMRALSGSTNTNTPYSGSVALTNTNVLVFSNGILQSVQ